MTPADKAFLSRLNPQRVKRADRIRLLELMAAAVAEDGHDEAAARLLADAETVKAGKPLRRELILIKDNQVRRGMMQPGNSRETANKEGAGDERGDAGSTAPQVKG